jgi:hypothetical protein
MVLQKKAKYKLLMLCCHHDVTASKQSYQNGLVENLCLGNMERTSAKKNSIRKIEQERLLAPG